MGDTMELGKLRYGKIFLLMDADADGHHIATLLLTFFFRHMKPLIDSGHPQQAPRPCSVSSELDSPLVIPAPAVPFPETFIFANDRPHRVRTRMHFPSPAARPPDAAERRYKRKGEPFRTTYYSGK